MKNIAIFASGNGSNAQNIIEHFNATNIARIKLIICNKPDAYVLERAAALNVPSVVLPKEELTNETPAALLSLLEEQQIHYIVLAGYLLKIPALLTEVYSRRIINIHPALLPKFGGKGMYGQYVHKAVIEAKERESGITIHLVDAVYDNGTILAQASCPVLESDTPETLADRIHALEKEHFAVTIEGYIKQDWPRTNV